MDWKYRFFKRKLQSEIAAYMRRIKAQRVQRDNPRAFDLASVRKI